MTGEAATQGTQAPLVQEPITGLGTPQLPPDQGYPRPQSTNSGYTAPLIKPAPDFLTGDPYARRPGSPTLLPPPGGSLYRPPYTVDNTGNYYDQSGAYRGKVDNQGRVFDQYGTQRGVINR